MGKWRFPDSRLCIWLRALATTGVDSFYANPVSRYLSYFILGAVYIMCCLTALAFFKGTDILINHMAFATVYALHTALTYACCQLAVDLLTARFLPRWGDYSERTVPKQWGVLAVGFVFGFVVHRSVIICLIHIYAPEIAEYYSDSAHQRPHTAFVFIYILPFWMAGTLFTFNIIKHLQKSEISRPDSKASDQEATDGFLTVEVNKKTIAIPYKHISHVTVEDHYSTIHFTKNGDLKAVFTRISLKTLLQSLPKDLFFQIHRSHLVNVRHVFDYCGKRRRITMAGGQQTSLPVSRHRLAGLDTVLKTGMRETSACNGWSHLE